MLKQPTSATPPTTAIPFWNRLRSRLTLYLVVLAVGAVVTVTSFALIQVRNQSTEQTFRQLVSVAQLKINQLDRWLQNSETALHLVSSQLEQSYALASQLEKTNGELSDGTRHVITAMLTANAEAQSNLTLSSDSFEAAPILKSIFIYNTRGNVLSSSDETLQNRIVTLQPYFQPSLAGDYLQSPYYDVSSGQLTMVQTHRLINAAGETVGILAGTLNLDVLGEIMLERAGLGDTGETYLISLENNYFLTPSRFEDIEMNRAYRSDGINTVLAGSDGQGIYPDYRGVSVLGVYQWIPQLSAGFLAEIDEGEAQTLFYQTTNVVIALEVLIMVVAAIAGLVVANQIAKPITNLTEVASEVAAGDYKRRAEVKQRNEIGVLGDAFNQMTDQLVQTIGELDGKIIEINTTNDELRIATAKAREAARVKGEFLANISHELRTPLNAIIGFSDMLLMGMSGELNPKQRHKMERLRENGTRLLNLINDILDLTRIEARRIEVVDKPFSPHALIERISQQTGVLADQRGLEFRVRVNPNMPETLIGDEKRIEQIVVNLLSNAFKFTEKGFVELSAQANADQQTWSLSVADTGIGIPPHSINIIFEEFRQVHGGSNRAFKGTGLGLAITRNLARIMDGNIAVQSELGKGSTFTVTLPILHVDQFANPTFAETATKIGA